MPPVEDAAPKVVSDSARKENWAGAINQTSLKKIVFLVV